jgi:cytochrome c oxidase subunit 2
MPSRIQSALDSAGVQAARIESLWWLMFWVCSGVFVLVAAAVFLAVRRGRSSDGSRPTERHLFIGVTAATATTIVILFGLLYASVATGRAIGAPPPGNALTVRVVGHQWWWELEYLDSDPSLRVTAANELALPVGRPVILRLSSSDVIHSFWIPNLHGKIDLVPGRENRTWLQADTPGVFRGQCAEYCGLQHAHMALTVLARPADEFDRWLTAQRRSAPPPTTPEQARGLNVVEHGSCGLCHTVRGTRAGARMGPDLTHFGTRSTIGAGTAPNTRGHLADWLVNPQRLKPGNRMPPTGLSPQDLQGVLAYLESLR